MKNKLKLITILFFALTLTGCTTYLEDEDNNKLKNPETGQQLVSNILCQPENEETLKLYEENNKDITSLPMCSELSITGGEYEGIWNTIFVKPLAVLIIFLGNLLSNYGFAIILTTLLIRTVMYPLTQKQAKQSESLKMAQPEIGALEIKYKNKTDQESMMQKSQETMAIYKKYDINPLSGCLFAFIQIPLFFAFFEALNRLPAVFEGEFLGMNMGMTSLTGVTNGNFIYLFIIIGVIAATHFSFKFNSGAQMSGDQAKQMQTMQKVMIVMISFSACFVSTAIGIYWITNSSFTIMQNLIVKRRK
ncbi:MAG: YidC/Oxa1 family membrane protein insertase [Mycoplasmatota bacterium]